MLSIFVMYTYHMHMLEQYLFKFFAHFQIQIMEKLHLHMK